MLIRLVQYDLRGKATRHTIERASFRGMCIDGIVVNVQNKGNFVIQEYQIMSPYSIRLTPYHSVVFTDKEEL